MLALFALCSAVALSACTRNAETSAAAAPAVAAQAASDAGKPAEPAGAGTAPAVATAAPELPQPAIVIPPKPKAGAPHGPGFDMPLLELGGYAPPRPMDILKDAHVFAADHPEVASYIPCYCGCGNMGHKNNADCFVDSRDKEGKVTAWVPHGAACAVCIDIAVESMKMRNSGASVSAIRKQIQDEYRPKFPSSETPTPAPPPGR
jgi:Protein of unknown function with PCYCGC motif